MPRLNDSTRAERRSRIAAAALTCFARDGFANTSMADIIRESGLSSGSIYSHFSSKTEVLRFAMTSALESRILVAFGEGDARNFLTPGECFSRIVKGVQLDSARAHVLLQVWAQVPGDPELSPLATANIGRLRNLAAAALAPWAESSTAGDAEAAERVAASAANAIITAMLGYAIRLAVDTTVTADGLREAIAATLTGDAAVVDSASARPAG